MSDGLGRSKLGELRTFVSAAVRSPALIGAAVPTGSRVARRLAHVVPPGGAPVVVELGPGTGSVSAAIRDRLPAGGRYVAVELEPGMVAHLRGTVPDLELIEGNARDLVALLADAGIGPVDAVVGTLPWTLIPDADRAAILAAVAGVLRPDGVFTAIPYLHTLPFPPARRFRAQLDAAFGEVLLTSTVWRNVPPARTYVCRRPRVA